MQTLRPWLLFVAVACATVSLHAREAVPPAQVIVEGAGPLRLRSQAHRTHLLGTVDLYTIALYSDGAVDRRRLASAEVAKALRIEVSYADDVRRGVALAWQRELLPPLEPSASAHLERSFASLRTGGVVQIDYEPARGTSVRINKAVALSAAHHDLMLAFLDHWLGDRPVSEAMKRTLLDAS